MLRDEDIQSILAFVKKEPCTVQEIAQHIGKSWVTTDSYVEKIKERTGELQVKTFRKGTQGAIKLVYYNHGEHAHADEIRASIYQQIRVARFKHHFDFMEVFQFVPDKQKKLSIEQYKEENMLTTQRNVPALRQAQRTVFIFSGNLSVLFAREGKTQLLSVLEELCARKVQVKIICRVTLGTKENIAKLKPLLAKYPSQIEIHHHYQPLRGIIVDDTVSVFKDEEQLHAYKKQELTHNTSIFYEVYDKDWNTWLQQVFWNIWRSSIDYRTRWKELEKIA